ncbi:MAG: beta-glucosidase [bacterium]|nr:beta-glucosidase [bacterium]
MTGDQLPFPQGFLWGTATSAYQIEGAVDVGGRGPSIWDTFSHTAGKTHNGENGDRAADHFNRLTEDVGLMKVLGTNAYRFSISWPRLLPRGLGEANPAGIRFYRDLAEMLREAGITPMATLYHWDLPQALQDRGGWPNAESPEWFAEYASVAKRELGDLITLWTTHNEPWCAAFLGHSEGEHAPGLKDAGLSYVAAHHLMLAHHKGIAAMRGTNPDPADRLGIVLNLIPAWPASDSPSDRKAAFAIDTVHSKLFLETAINGTYPELIREYHHKLGVADLIDTDALAESMQSIDFLGVNYYNINRVRFAAGAPAMGSWPGTDGSEVVVPPGELTDMGWGVDPEGLEWILRRVAADYPQLPMYVCENGAAYPDSVAADGSIDDQKRIAYLESHTAAVARAIGAGADVRGYFAWSLLDNFEWAEGYRMRFGLIGVDRRTMERTVKASGHWYRDFIAANS